MALRILATASGSTGLSVFTRMPRSAPMASPVRIVSVAWGGPSEMETILLGLPLLLQAKRLFDGDLIEGIHRHFDIGELDAGTVALDANFHIIVDDPFD